MMDRRTFSCGLASAMTGYLAGCGIRPQERVAPSGGVDVSTTARAAVQRMELRVLGSPAEATPRGYGFIPQSGQSYVVYEDGTARLFSVAGGQTDLQQFSPRIDSVFLAGPSYRCIIGYSHHGTATSWNSANLSQQLVMNPQQTTFGQVRMLHAARVAASPLLAAALEDGRLELWNLVSGNLARASHLRDGVAPRVIMPGSHSGAIVFGTESGDVRVWSGGRHTRLQYSHRSRVLSISDLGNGCHISTSQDGRALLYNGTLGKTIGEAQFDRAIYDSYAPRDGSFAIALPALGLPVIFDISTGVATRLQGPAQSRFAQGELTHDGRFFAARHINGSVFVWDMLRGGPWQTRPEPVGTGAIERRYGDIAVGFAISVSQRAILLANDTSVQMFDLHTSRALGTVLTSTTRIVGLRTTRSGDRVLVSLSDGRLIQFHPRRDTLFAVPVV